MSYLIDMKMKSYRLLSDKKNLKAAYMGRRSIPKCKISVCPKTTEKILGTLLCAYIINYVILCLGRFHHHFIAMRALQLQSRKTTNKPS